MLQSAGSRRVGPVAAACGRYSAGSVVVRFGQRKKVTVKEEELGSLAMTKGPRWVLGRPWSILGGGGASRL